MGVAWVSPLSPCRAGQADNSELLLPELAQYAEIDLAAEGYTLTHPPAGAMTRYICAAGVCVLQRMGTDQPAIVAAVDSFRELPDDACIKPAPDAPLTRWLRLQNLHNVAGTPAGLNLAGQLRSVTGEPLDRHWVYSPLLLRTRHP